MRHAAWSLMFLGLFVVMLGELDFFLASLLWPALVFGATLPGSGMLLLAGERIAWALEQTGVRGAAVRVG
jgi:hypothetical protein